MCAKYGCTITFLNNRAHIHVDAQVVQVLQGYRSGIFYRPILGITADLQPAPRMPLHRFPDLLPYCKGFGQTCPMMTSGKSSGYALMIILYQVMIRNAVLTGYKACRTSRIIIEEIAG